MKPFIQTITIFLFSVNQISLTQNIIPINDELILPKYALGGTSGGAAGNRLPFVCRLKISGLLADRTYHYVSGASNSSTITTMNLPGGFFVINNLSGSAGYITGYSTSKGLQGTLMSNNEFVNAARYGEFVTDALGSYTGWFCCVATTNLAFTTGNQIYFYIQVNDGANGTSVYLAFRTTSTITILDYGTTSGGINQSSAVVGKSFACGEEIILLYDNISGSGRPLFATFTESDGITTDWTTWYKTPNGPDGINGRWGAVIPNALPNGLQRIERKLIPNNNPVDFNTSSSGMWGLISTVNPSNGISPMTIDSIDAPLPVKLAYFNSSIEKNNVVLKWSTHFETNNKGFVIERIDKDNIIDNIGFIKGNGNSLSEKFYSFEDKHLVSGTYKYRLKQIDFNGNFEYFNLSNNVIIGTPNEFIVSQNYPNPSNPVTKIYYQIPSSGFVNIKLYNISGQEVENLFGGNKESGYHSITFDCSNHSSGIYFYKIMLISNGNIYTQTKKMVVLK